MPCAVDLRCCVVILLLGIILRKRTTFTKTHDAAMFYGYIQIFIYPQHQYFGLVDLGVGRVYHVFNVLL